MRARHRSIAGFSLIELLLVISIMAILAGLVMPKSGPAIHDQLVSAARIMAADLAYARSLAVAQSSPYRITFDLTNNRYILQNSEGKDLPQATFDSPDDTPKRHVVDLGQLPNMAAVVRLVAVARGENSMTQASDVEFGRLGETTCSDPTHIWLSAGQGSAARYIKLSVNPVTGLTMIGDFSGEGPPAELK
jgi:prepilin-type N-terminal cleavage/methylation domain-containing protein